MDNLLFWVVIGLLGFILYISPGFFVYRMYESFGTATAPVPAAAAPAPPTKEMNTAGAATAVLQPSAAPKPAPPSQNQIQNLLEILNTPPPSASPTAAPVAAVAVGGTPIPTEYETTRSRPESTRTLAGPSEALKHGDLYNALLPKNPSPGSNGMLGSMGTQARVPAERVVYIERERDNKERPTVNPNCPDMREYIRKDSIPCWGCKLR